VDRHTKSVELSVFASTVHLSFVREEKPIRKENERLRAEIRTVMTMLR
jgi:hypothetical protein